MSFKKIIFVALCAMPLIASASDLTITNDTNRDSTSITNSGFCSAALPGGSGVTRKHTTNVVPEKLVNMACKTNSENCQADVYMSANCSGPKVASVIFSTSTGIKSVQMNDTSYAITGSGFTIRMTGGPAIS